MISLTSGTLLKDESYCKFILKNDLKNYFRQFTKTLNICFQRNTIHTDLVMRNCILLEQLNICAEYGII